MSAQFAASGKRARSDRPAKGTIADRVLNALLSGERVALPKVVQYPNLSYAIAQLRDRYGMEIETNSKGSRLLGEWDGPYFVPVERMMR